MKLITLTVIGLQLLCGAALAAPINNIHQDAQAITQVESIVPVSALVQQADHNMVSVTSD